MGNLVYEAITDSEGNLVVDPKTGKPELKVTMPPPLPGEEIAHVCWTGKRVKGIITMGDGTLYDVTPDMIQISEKHVGVPIDFRIRQRLEETGDLTAVVHGDDYDGPGCIVVGDERRHLIGHVGDTLESLTEAPPAATE